MSGSFTTSASLVDRARNDDAEAWKRLVHIYGPLVEHWCRRSGVPQGHIEDVIQDIFVSVVRQLGQFRYERPQDTFRGWLRVITQRRIADFFRSHANQPQGEGGTTALRRSEDMASPFHDDRDAESEEAEISQRALELLRLEFEPRTWQAFWRTAIESASAVEVGAELGLSPAAVRMAKSRVLSRLRQELSGILAW